MPNPFGKNGGPVNSVPRNTCDLSHQVNGTYQFGGCYPVACIPVLPGDSFKIDTTFGLRFMPTAFPLQTRMRADIHAFYVRNRNLWKDWPDFYGKTKENLVPPYIKGDGVNVSLKTGGLADHLNVPTTIVGKFGNKVSLFGGSYYFNGGSLSYIQSSGSDEKKQLTFDTEGNISPDLLATGLDPVIYPATYTYNAGSVYSTSPRGYYYSLSNEANEFLSNSDSIECSIVLSFYNAAYKDYFRGKVLIFPASHAVISGGLVSSIQLYEPLMYTSDAVEGSTMTDVTYKFDLPSGCDSIFILVPSTSAAVSDPSNTFKFINPVSEFAKDFVSSHDVVNPFDTTNQGSLALSALPFRAYESIYNSFYRDERNNPYIIDGEKEYNRYIPSTDGGLDNNEYKIRFRNWEQDFLTTAVPTPQQGVAPLVGISATGVMSISDPDTGQVYQVQAKTADDADTIVGYDVTETLPKAVTRSLVNYASSGISINDFRNVNAYQRWLETNIRRGFKYRDMIKSHFDVDISYQELDMPEFIGGVSIDIVPQTISQTSADSESNPLGSYAGQLYGSGSSKHSITQYCDEHGYIMLILSVVPVPNYSQLLPKDFLKTDSLDYFSPEFGHIGLQAIPYSEVCPVQVANDPDSNLTDTFGYQRAWYDYLQLYDTVHGQFRTTLRNFVMNRVFDEKPVLGPSFTTIDPKQLNDVFTVSEVEGEPIDPILGQIYFDIKAKRPIPRYGVPRLE